MLRRYFSRVTHCCDIRASIGQREEHLLLSLGAHIVVKQHISTYFGANYFLILFLKLTGSELGGKRNSLRSAW